jgi:hypothetical protein
MSRESSADERQSDTSAHSPKLGEGRKLGDGRRLGESVPPAREAGQEPE